MGGLITGASGRVYYVTEEAPDLYAVRFMLPGRHDYEQAILVRVSDQGRALFLSIWLGNVPGSKSWLQARDDLFPAARSASFKRCNAITGKVRERTVPLPPPEIPREE